MLGRNDSASRDNPNPKVERLSSGDRRDYAPVTQVAKDRHHQQGIYFCEYRNYGGARKLVVTIMGESLYDMTTKQFIADEREAPPHSNW